MIKYLPRGTRVKAEEKDGVVLQSGMSTFDILLIEKGHRRQFEKEKVFSLENKIDMSDWVVADLNIYKLYAKPFGWQTSITAVIRDYGYSTEEVQQGLNGVGLVSYVNETTLKEIYSNKIVNSFIQFPWSKNKEQLSSPLYLKDRYNNNIRYFGIR